MNFFGGNKEPSGPSPVAQAKLEVEVMSDMFNKMSAACFRKCVTAYHSDELSVGEMTCIDRCTGKYYEAQTKVGEILKQSEEQLKLQAAQGAKFP